MDAVPTAVVGDDGDDNEIKHLLTATEMMFQGLRLLRYTWRRIKRSKVKHNMARFKTHFGLSPGTAVWIYEDLQRTTIADAKITGSKLELKYFLMGLHFLKKYPTEEDMTARFDYSNYWSREKVWKTAERIRALKATKIVWEEGLADGEVWVMTVDGIHCWIAEPTHPEWSQDPKYYSHKYGKAGLVYELGICLKTSRLLWIRGPLPAGTNDITVFRSALKAELELLFFINNFSTCIQ